MMDATHRPALGFSVIQAADTWTLEEILEYLPEAAKLRFPNDVEALKAKISDRMQSLI